MLSTRVWRFVGVVVAVSAAVLLASGIVDASADPSDAPCRPVWQQAVPLQFVERDATVPVDVNGQATQFAFDTGTSDTYILKEGRSKFALPPAPSLNWEVGTAKGRRSQLEFVRVDDLRFAGLAFGARALPVSDLEYAADSPARAVETGLMGIDLLKDLDIDIDIPAKQIVLYRFDRAHCQVKPLWPFDYATIPITTRRSGVPMIPIAINGVTVQVLFDTGAARTTLQYDEDDEDDYARLGIAAEGDRNWLRSFVIGGQPERPFEINVEDRALSSRNNTRLGIDVIGRHRFWLSLPSKTLFMKTGGSP